MTVIIYGTRFKVYHYKYKQLLAFNTFLYVSLPVDQCKSRTLGNIIIESASCKVARFDQLYYCRVLKYFCLRSRSLSPFFKLRSARSQQKSAAQILRCFKEVKTMLFPLKNIFFVNNFSCKAKCEMVTKVFQL